MQIYINTEIDSFQQTFHCEANDFSFSNNNCNVLIQETVSKNKDQHNPINLEKTFFLVKKQT